MAGIDVASPLFSFINHHTKCAHIVSVTCTRTVNMNNTAARKEAKQVCYWSEESAPLCSVGYRQRDYMPSMLPCSSTCVDWVTAAVGNPSTSRFIEFHYRYSLKDVFENSSTGGHWAKWNLIFLDTCKDVWCKEKLHSSSKQKDKSHCLWKNKDQGIVLKCKLAEQLYDLLFQVIK